MNKNLIISAVGDNSLHEKWVGSDSVDLFLIYYGNNETNLKKYKSQSTYFLNIKTKSKYEFLKEIITDNFEKIQQYGYIWLPDDDLDIDIKDIEEMFLIMEKYDLWIAQPSVVNNVNLPITANKPDSDIRFTNFVEVMAPAFKKETMLYLSHTFGATESMWGMEHVWNALLGAPKNKIAVIDKLIMKHTKTTGSDYSRFKTSPYVERKELWDKYMPMLIKTNSLKWYNKVESFKNLDNIKGGNVIG
jgi:hypothetical protein